MRTRVEELFHAVADLSVEERTRYFDDRGIDAETRREVEELLAFDATWDVSLEGDIGRIARRALERLEAKDLDCGPYRLTEPLGRGGAGAVYAAERVDGEVTQRVAVKLLQPGVDDPSVRQRFLAERQILASLSHPNIARLLDAGHREDGQPYLVMEYVEGKPIDVFTEGFGLRRKIALFLKVCAAVSYLHRNLVVHRDLKPGNILVTRDGEPMLLDFGIAKIVDFTADPAVTGMRMLTPDYASPEQVGDCPITTAADIYSLGAVLYRLLTGSPPHQFEGRSAAAIASVIAGGEITPPAKIRPGLDRDLEIVLLKAMRKEPQERYATVDALAEDLRATLDGRPIRARSDEAWYRARKWFRRHWIPAAAAALVLASLAAGLYLANRQRAIAEQRFGQLRQLSNRVIDLDAAIRALPGSVDARRRLVAASLEYLEGLSQEARGNLDLALEISDGYWRMARIQGVNAELNLGDTANAEESLKKADRLVESVLAVRPGDRGALFRSAVIAHDRMILADTEDRRPDSVTQARKSVERLEAFLKRDGAWNPGLLVSFLGNGDPKETERIGAASLYMNIALSYVNLHFFEEGARYARRTVELAQPIPSAQYIASQGLSMLANALRYQGDLEAALKTIQQAWEVSERAAYPTPTARIFGRYGVMLREGRILAEEGSVNLDRPAEAIDILQTAMDMADEVARKDPNDSASRARVAAAARELGDILRDRDPRRALAVYDRGIQRVTEMRNSLKARRDRAQLLANSSYSLRRLHRVDEAKERIDTAFAILQETKDYPAERIRLNSYQYAIVSARADYEAEAGSPARALEIYDDLLRRVLATRPDPESNLPDAAGMSRVYAAVEQVSRRNGQRERAATLEAERLALWRRWDARLPHNAFVRRQLHATGT